MQTLNGFEEILENLAAVLFCISVLLVFIDIRWPAASSKSYALPKTAFALGVTIALTGITTVVWSNTGNPQPSPVAKESAVRVIGAPDGLFHADDAFFHPRWGLLIANEGLKGFEAYLQDRITLAVPEYSATGGVIQFKNEMIKVLPDPQNLLQEIDSVTATGEAVYVTSSSLNTVFKYTEEKGWEPFLTQENGLQNPEGITIAGSMMYILDENLPRIYAVNMITKELESMPLMDPRWITPQGIAYHPLSGELLITDENTGYIIGVTFGKPPRIFASPEDGLSHPEGITLSEDGDILVTDTRRREVIRFSQDGSVSGRIKFSRNYGFIVGIAVVKGKKEELYVVQADGNQAKSWIPSSVWKIDGMKWLSS